MVVEGIKTTKSAYNLSLQFDVDMPITKEIYGKFFTMKKMKNSVVNLMLRDKNMKWNILLMVQIVIGKTILICLS